MQLRTIMYLYLSRRGPIVRIVGVKSMASDPSALIVMQRCDILAGYSEEPDRLTRRFASAPMQQVNTVVGAWMQDAGMSVQQDAFGNLIGHYAAREPDARTLVLGSHLDSVRDAGKYDGPLGVMV